MSDPIPQAALGTSSGLSVPAEATPGHEVVESPNRPRPDDELVRYVAELLRRIEVNYDREGSGPGGRFEGRLLEDVQAERAVREVAVPLREEIASLRGDAFDAARLADRYRKALEAIDALALTIGDAVQIARQALEGGGDG